MPSTPVLIYLFVAGYVLIRSFPAFSYRVHRLSSNIQYLHIALSGIILFFLSAIVYVPLYMFSIPQKLSESLYLYNKINNAIVAIFIRNNFVGDIDLLNIIIISFVITTAFCLVNLCRNKRIVYKILSCVESRICKHHDNGENNDNNTIEHVRKKIARISPFESVIVDSIEKKLPICLTLENGKVYVGFITDAPDMTASRREVKMTPWFSGYRDEHDKKIEFTTFYTDLYQQENIDVSIFRKVIPYDDIKSTNLFDIKIYYNEFKPKIKRTGESAKVKLKK
jgi:hypothetical protein